MKNAPPAPLTAAQLKQMAQDQASFGIMVASQALKPSTAPLPDFGELSLKVIRESTSHQALKEIIDRTDLTSFEKIRLIKSSHKKLIREKKKVDAEIADLEKLEEMHRLADPRTLPLLERVDLWRKP